MKRFNVAALQRFLIHVNIPNNRSMRCTLFSSRDLIVTSIVHICDDHSSITIELTNNGNMTINRMCSRPRIHDNRSRDRSISSRYSLFSSICEPRFSVSSPCHIFIFCNKTCTVSIGKISTSFAYFERKRIVSSSRR